MTHARKTIRDNVVATVTGLTTTGSNVHPTRVFTLAQSDLPCLCIYTDEEESEVIGMNGQLRRALTVRVAAYARQIANVENQLDTIAEEVETALVESAVGGIRRFYLIGTSLDYSSEGDGA